ncbi:MAG: helix-turn-helix transcriptional regulator [Tenacibaculum sp.]|nr:helix-turn-helix transcriptional regulator [Tenacibaculum sp.]
MNIGTKIRQLREEKQMSQTDLAYMLNIEQATLSKIESNKTEKLNFFTIDKLCQIFNKNFDYFLPTQGNTYNVETNNGVVVGTYNNFPPELLNLVKDIIHNHEQQTLKIKELEEQLKNR